MSRLVASFTDAWIETCIVCRKRKANALSHLLQMRGLKLKVVLCPSQVWVVASFTDAWIETYNSPSAVMSRLKSHLLQMRGLKPS